MKPKRRIPLTRGQLLWKLPQALRPKLDAQTQQELSLVHYLNLDGIKRDNGDKRALLDWAEGVLTNSKLAELLKIGEAEMAEQLKLSAKLLIRQEQTGRVCFEGDEYALALTGVAVMEELAAKADRANANQAALWSVATMAAMPAKAGQEVSLAVADACAAAALKNNERMAA